MPYKDPEKRKQHGRRKRDRSEYESRPEVRERRRRNSTYYWDRMSADERWAAWIKARHGLYPAQWQSMYADQDGNCYLCLQALPEDRSKIAVDHDHSHCPKGRSCALCRRGLACPACNTAIGLLGDSAERLRTVADNLERAQAVVQALINSAPIADALF